VKNFLWGGVCLVVVSLATDSAIAQSPAGLSSPSKSELESTIKGMGLSMPQKLSMRTILRAMQEQGAKVKADGTISDEQKVAQIVKIRQNALDQTKKFLTAPQQQQLAALLLPKA